MTTKTRIANWLFKLAVRVSGEPMTDWYWHKMEERPDGLDYYLVRWKRDELTFSVTDAFYDGNGKWTRTLLKKENGEIIETDIDITDWINGWMPVPTTLLELK